MLRNNLNLNQDHRKKLKYFNENKNQLVAKEFIENKIDNLKLLLMHM